MIYINLSKYARPQLTLWFGELNLTEDEEQIYWMLAKNKSIKEIAYKSDMSITTVNRRIKSIKSKLKQIGAVI